MSATNKDSDKEAERGSNEDGENPGGSKGDGGKENPGGSKGDGDRKNLDDMDDEDSDDDNSDDAEDDDGGENSDDTYDEDGGENPGDTPGKTEIARRGKFEFASDLSNYIHKVREEYWKCLESEKKDKESMGVILYIVEKFSLRSGTKNTVFLDDPTGVCRLKNGHITFPEDGSVHFHFNGKSNITYDKIHPVEPKVYEILKERANGRESAELFPGITAQQVNNCLEGIMPGLTIRVFRTYNGSLKMQNELEKATQDVAKGTSAITVYEKVLEIVAAYLNHQRAAKPQASRSSDQNSDVLAKKMSKTSLDSPQEKADELPKGMEWNLDSSKTFYIDHRVVILWCKKNKIPIEKIYTVKERESYKWEIDEVETLVKENTSFQTFYYYYYYIKRFDC